MTAPAQRKAPLLAIRPDPDQPRTLLPPDLVGLFTNGLMTPQAIMSEWQKSPNQALSAIVTLADSIAQHGQINPISVQPTQSLPGIEYLIVTGERRWWAHVLLTTQGRDIYEGDTRNPADKIKINLVTKGVSIRAHQLIENVVREDLCAVEKAHGMWALRYELSGKNYRSVLPTSAQEKYLVGWDQVEKSLGVSSRYRQYVASVLKLTPDALRLVTEHGLSESTIRPITQKLHKYADLQMQALRQLVAWQESEGKHSLVKEVKQLVEGLVTDIPQVGGAPRPSLLPLEVPEKKRSGPKAVPAGTVSVPEQRGAPPVTSASISCSAPVPRVPQPSLAEPSQKPLMRQDFTLRTRPESFQEASAGLGHACAHLIEVLNQIDSNDPFVMRNLTNSKKELITLKNKIEQLIS